MTDKEKPASAQTEAILGLAAVTAIIELSRPRTRLRIIRRIAREIGDLTVIPLHDGVASRQATELRALYSRILPRWLGML